MKTVHLWGECKIITVDTDKTQTFKPVLSIKHAYIDPGWVLNKIVILTALYEDWVVRCWHGSLSWARCRLAYGPAAATATHYLLLQ